MGNFDLQVVLSGTEAEDGEHARHMAEDIAADLSERQEIQVVRLRGGQSVTYANGGAMD